MSIDIIVEVFTYLELFIRHDKAERVDYLMQIFFWNQSIPVSVKRSKSLEIPNQREQSYRTRTVVNVLLLSSSINLKQIAAEKKSGVICKPADI